jgi:hypothetical protein
MEPGSVVIVDFTGLKVYRKDEWYQEKHNVSSRHTWRKLHIAIGENYQVLACELTTLEVGDTTAVPYLLAQIETNFETFIGDGAYDGDQVSQAVLEKEPKAKVVIPPPKTAVLSTTEDTQRDQHIQTIKQQGRMAWQRETGYNLSSLVELSIQRYKRIFGNIMKARKLSQQKTEAWISLFALNIMTSLGMSVSVKI